MALVKDGVLLAAFKQTKLTGLTVGSAGTCVVLTQSNRRVAVYHVADQKLVYDWLSKTGQELTCPAVELPESSQYAVIVNSQILRIWNHNETSIDKGSKIKLTKSGHRLFVIGGELIVLYSDGSLGVRDRLLFETETVENNAQQQQQIVWCEQTADSVVAVFRDKSRSKQEQYYVRLYTPTQTVNSATASVSETSLSLATKRTYPVAFCTQSIDTELYLVAMNASSQLSRTCLTSLSSHVDLPSPPFVKKSSHFLAVAPLDSTQLAVIGSQSEDNPAVGVGVWDTKFGVFHSWTPLVGSGTSSGKLYYVNRRLLLSCTDGIYSFGVVPKTATLLACVGKTPVTGPVQLQSGDQQGNLKKVVLTLQQLSQSSQTSTYEAFQSAFQFVTDWLSHCDKDDKLRVLPLVNAVVLRCAGEKQFWPTNQLVELIKAKLVAPSLCPQVFKAFATHNDIPALMACFTCLTDIPESALVTALSCFLSAEESMFSGVDTCSLSGVDGVDADVDDVSVDDDLPAVFTDARAYCINRVLSLPFNDVFLLDSLHQLNYSQVLNLIRHLEYLLCTTSAVKPPTDNNCRPSLLQVIDWLSLLIDAHYPQMALSADTQQLHDRLQAALQLQRQDVELMSEIDDHLLYILRGKKIVEKTVGLYCITMLHID